MTSAYVNHEIDVCEAIVWRRIVVELLAFHRRVDDLPLAVVDVTVDVDVDARVGEIHLRRVIRPRPEYHVALLGVERVVGDVYLADGFEDACKEECNFTDLFEYPPLKCIRNTYSTHA